VYLGPGKVEVQSIDYPKLQNPAGKKIDHGVILKIVTTNICGSDQHMVRGRTTALAGLVLGHEITGEVIEKGSDVEFLNLGDLVTVPFNIACGRCRNCRLRLRGHGRMGRRPGGLCSGAVCRFQPDQVPR
jgi:glutathione-independent formaldehyde dehydrogenase